MLYNNDLVVLADEIDKIMINFVIDNKEKSNNIEEECIKYTINKIMNITKGGLNPKFVESLVHFHKFPFIKFGISYKC